MTCAIYCRLSKEDENNLQESESIQNQKNLLIAHALQQEWDIYNIYCDDDYSGADQDRPEWSQMLRAAQAEKFQIVLCKNQSRFTRDLEMVEKYIHGLFPLWGIRFVALLDNVDTDVKGNKKARQINGLINEWYLEDLSENVRAVLDQKRRAGKYIGSFPAYGYQKDPSDHNHLIVDEEAAENVRLIYEMYLNGTGTQHIAYYLNEHGLPNPSKYKQEKGWNYVNAGERKGQGLWTNVTVSRILRNEVYTGTLVQGTKRKASYKSKKLLDIPKDQWTRVEGTHEPIIDRETFEVVQHRMSKRTHSNGFGETHVLSGKTRCDCCGHTMIKISNVYKGERRSYLQCSLYAATRKQPQCTKHTIRLDRLTVAVEDRLKEYVQRFYEPGELSRFQPEDNAKKRIAAMEKEIIATNQQIAKLSAGIRNLYLDKVDGTVSKEQFLEMNNGFLEEKKKLKQKVQMLESRIEELGVCKAANTRLEVRVKELLKLDSIGRELYDLLIDTVQIGEKDAEMKIQKIHINWKI